MLSTPNSCINEFVSANFQKKWVGAVRWLNAFSWRCKFERKCDRCFEYCVHCALFAHAVLLDRYPPGSVPKRYLFRHVCWARAIKLLRFTWQCRVTLHLGTQLANDISIGQPIGGLVPGCRFRHGKKQPCKTNCCQDDPKQADLPNRLYKGIPVD